MKVFGITGWKNSGKTTLICRLIEHFTAQGYRVSTIKHTHHDVQFDQTGKDSFKHRDAGAHEVLLASKNRWAIFHEQQQEPELDTLINALEKVDLLLIEGFKQHRHPKIWVYRQDMKAIQEQDLLANTLAIASDQTLGKSGLPVLDLNNIQEIADFIWQHSKALD